MYIRMDRRTDGQTDMIVEIVISHLVNLHRNKEEVADFFFMASNMIEEGRKIKNSIFLRWPFEKIRVFCLDTHKSWIWLSQRHFFNKVIK